ncbi:MAG: cyclic nucleotide-binding domain-containing protein [Ignavibacteriales bacterium]|nr:cyclic nucleotide-binding domain-containing protein [Ignavibacteriales bacterium]MBI3787612.1 cyclic nucleotide-binding domain-containing protein [Ignavibacteriales bacterium]
MTKVVESAIWKNIFSGRGVSEGSTESLLSKVPAFANLSARELKEVAAIVHKREYQPAESVFFQGDPGLGMYIIQEGEISITIAEKDGGEKELAVLSEGDFFGELALLDESPRSATAICRTKCSLIGFFRPDLFQLIEKKTNLGIKIVLKLAEIVAERLRKTDRELSKLKNQLDHLKPQRERENDGKEKTDPLQKINGEKKNPSRQKAGKGR